MFFSSLSTGQVWVVKEGHGIPGYNIELNGTDTGITCRDPISLADCKNDCILTPGCKSIDYSVGISNTPDQCCLNSIGMAEAKDIGLRVVNTYYNYYEPGE